jgi:hypothetical protein
LYSFMDSRYPRNRRACILAVCETGRDPARPLCSSVGKARRSAEGSLPPPLSG